MPVRTLAIAALAITASTLHAQVVYEQLPATGPALISAAEPGAQFTFADRRRADNFTLNTDAIITGLTFWGGDETNTIPTPLANIAGFNIVIHRDAGSGPGVPIAVYDFDINQLIATPTGQTVGLLNAERYEFTVNFTIPQTITLDADDYIISVAARYNNPVDFNNEAFQWASSLPGDGVLYSDSYDGNGYQFAGSFARTNTAFRILGDTITQDTCPTDTNDDGVTDLADLLAVLAAFGDSCN